MTIIFFNSQKTMYGANVIIFEGILAFYSPDVLKVNVLCLLHALMWGIFLDRTVRAVVTGNLSQSVQT